MRFLRSGEIPLRRVPQEFRGNREVSRLGRIARSLPSGDPRSCPPSVSVHSLAAGGIPSFCQRELVRAIQRLDLAFEPGRRRTILGQRAGEHFGGTVGPHISGAFSGIVRCQPPVQIGRDSRVERTVRATQEINIPGTGHVWGNLGKAGRGWHRRKSAPVQEGWRDPGRAIISRNPLSRASASWTPRARRRRRISRASRRARRFFVENFCARVRATG